MAPRTIRQALGAVKDQTTIGIAMVSNSSTASDLEIAIVKATCHDECPADEKHIREILRLTCYSRGYIKLCVNTVAKRLNKTRNWIVALKTLMLVHRLLLDGDASYEQEIFYATRRGTRLLNMADFRDTSRSGSWDFSAFVRTYALYLDERLEFRMQAKRGGSKPNGRGGSEGDGFEQRPVVVRSTPVQEMKTERIFLRAQHLLNLLERFLACRPAGEAKHNRIVIVALYPVVKESFQIYYDITKFMGVLVDRFMELEIPHCVKVHEIFTRIGKQFDELDKFYCWCKSIGIARSSDYPEVEIITAKKLEIMADFIRDKSILAQTKKSNNSSPIHQKKEPVQEDEKEADAIDEEDLFSIRALPPPEGFDNESSEDQKMKQEDDSTKKFQNTQQLEADLLDLRDDSIRYEEEDQENKLALALFDGTGNSNSMAPTTSTSAWEAFKSEDLTDWETALVQSASHLSNQRLTLGGGFDMNLLDGMYQQVAINSRAMQHEGLSSTGSASSVALGLAAAAQNPRMLALPAPPVSGGNTAVVGGGDPFQASLLMPPPPYVQMSEMEKKQNLLVEEQLMWQQYANNGRQGHLGMPQLQPNSYSMGSYTYSY